MSSRLPTYTWQAVSGATEYYLWVSDARPAPVVQEWHLASLVCSGSTCAVTPSVRLADGQHTWWVQAKGELGTGPWSTGMVFNVKP